MKSLHAPRPARVHRVLASTAAAVVVVVGLKHLGGFFTPVLFGAMVAGASAPLVSWLKRRRVPVMVSAAVVLLLDFALLGSLGGLLLTAAGDLQERLPGYVSRLLGLASALAPRIGPSATHTIHEALEADRLTSAVSALAEHLLGVTSFGAVVAFVVFFTLCEGEDLGVKLRALQPGLGARLDKLERVLLDVRSYLLVKSLTSFLAAGATWLVMDLFGLPLASLVALSMFVLHFVPNIGAAVATLAAMAVALVEGGTGTALCVGAAMGLIGLVVGSVLEPQFLGRALRLSPLMVLLGMLFWGFLWGPVGALLSVPLMVVAKAALENSELQWLAQLLGNRAAEPLPPARKPVLVFKRRAPADPELAGRRLEAAPVPPAVAKASGQNAP